MASSAGPAAAAAGRAEVTLAAVTPITPIGTVASIAAVSRAVTTQIAEESTPPAAEHDVIGCLHAGQTGVAGGEKKTTPGALSALAESTGVSTVCPDAAVTSCSAATALATVIAALAAITTSPAVAAITAPPSVGTRASRAPVRGVAEQLSAAHRHRAGCDVQTTAFAGGSVTAGARSAANSAIAPIRTGATVAAVSARGPRGLGTMPLRAVPAVAAASAIAPMTTGSARRCVSADLGFDQTQRPARLVNPPTGSCPSGARRAAGAGGASVSTCWAVRPITPSAAIAPVAAAGVVRANLRVDHAQLTARQVNAPASRVSACGTGGAGKPDAPRRPVRTVCPRSVIARDRRVADRHLPAVDENSAAERDRATQSAAVVCAAVGDLQVLEYHGDARAAATGDFKNPGVPRR